MLNNLYRKLYILFSVSIMLIISLVIAFAVTTAVHSDRENESTMFQRMTTLLIYQLENSQSDMESTIQSYEDKYDLFVRLENNNGQEIYQSKSFFSYGNGYSAPRGFRTDKRSTNDPRGKQLFLYFAGWHLYTGWKKNMMNIMPFLPRLLQRLTTNTAQCSCAMFQL